MNKSTYADNDDLKIRKIIDFNGKSRNNPPVNKNKSQLFKSTLKALKVTRNVINFTSQNTKNVGTSNFESLLFGILEIEVRIIFTAWCSLTSLVTLRYLRVISIKLVELHITYIQIG